MSLAVPYRWVDHTAELELEIAASTEAAIFAEAFAAFAELLRDEGGGDGDGELVRRAVVADAPDQAVLLAEWLSELEYLVETDDLFPVAVSGLSVAEGHLEATVSGRRGAPPHLVKAVTYHRLSLARDAHGWRATVVLDV